MMAAHTIVVLHPDCLQPRYVSRDEQRLWMAVDGDSEPLPASMLREECLDWLLMVSAMTSTWVLLLGDHNSPRPRALNLKLTSGVDATQRIRGTIYTAADGELGVNGRLDSLLQAIGQGNLFPPRLPIEQRQIVWADSSLGSPAVRSWVRSELAAVAGAVTLIEPSPSYGLLPGDLWSISSRCGLMRPSHGFTALPTGPPGVDDDEELF